jgi:hypothetical protein
MSPKAPALPCSRIASPRWRPWAAMIPPSVSPTAVSRSISVVLPDLPDRWTWSGALMAFAAPPARSQRFLEAVSALPGFRETRIRPRAAPSQRRNIPTAFSTSSSIHSSAEAQGSRDPERTTPTVARMPASSTARKTPQRPRKTEPATVVVPDRRQSTPGEWTSTRSPRHGPLPAQATPGHSRAQVRPEPTPAEQAVAEMHMPLDQAGEHEQAGGVEESVAGERPVGPTAAIRPSVRNASPRKTRRSRSR